MDPTTLQSSGDQPAQRTYPGLALGSLICGILSVLSGFIIIGVVPALVGLILGFVHLVRSSARSRRAWIGVFLSGFGLILSLAMLGAVLWLVQTVRDGSRDKDALAAQWRGKPAPPLDLVTLDGATIRLSELRGRRVVLNFWATWCGPCRREIPHFVDLAEERGDHGITVIGVSNEKPRILRNFVAREEISYPVASVATADLPPPFSQVASIPTTFIIDRRGTIQFVAVGYLSREKLAKLAGAPDLLPESPLLHSASPP